MEQALERRQLIRSPLADVFAFFKDPYNLQAITPRWLRFEVRGATDGTVRAGTRIEYSLRWLGLPMHWESVIAEYEDNVLFTDEMIRGPYRRWRHTHLFRPAPGGVEMIDRVRYELPLGFLGSIAHALVVRRQLDRIFDYRSRRVAQLFD
ncbi:MAG: CDP-paratose 2-epimerase [Gemmatimonadales bacterium]|nr:CDP-paratose 2-epimerase [Gemmatimonadales bacterium]NIN12957.1 CDP-paratose 2-epimerase [Gemmatimonadales bacterium]NIR02632.1 CDP-paratose 2-epimerase [Gemmatimonadales bacterium]NIS67208.1 CDP-paratose 2-epimerase [Gemmatimonadales bacterium]